MKILIVDDDPLFRANYELLLGEKGYDLHLCANRSEAEAALGAALFDVVLLDQNLEGSSQGPTGLDLVPMVREAAPGAWLIIVSGYWDRPGVVQQAFERGVDDYLVKGEHLTPLLLAKIGQVERQIATRVRASRTDASLDQRLREVWSSLLSETQSHAKGRLLEELVETLLRLVGGFRDVRTNVRNELEEIDVVALADESSRWAKHSLVWVIECKNWSAKVGRSELDVLVGKMGRRQGQCSRGLMIAWGGVSEPFERGAHILQDWVVATAERADLAEIVASSDRSTIFQSWFDRAMLRP